MIRLLLIIGFLLNFAVYGNLYSTVVFLGIFYLSKLTTSLFLKKQKNSEKDITLFIFSLVYLLSALSEILFINFGPDAIPPDAKLFYKYASDPNWNINNFESQLISGVEIENILGLKEDFIPILIWNNIYKIINFVGIPTGKYIGTAINTLFIVWTSYIGLSIIRSTEYLNNKGIEKFYKILFCANGLFWMYGSFHIRESIILFFVSLLLKVWINWINKKSFFNLIILGIISTIYLLFAEYLRGGYSYLIYAFLISFLLANVLENIITRKVSKAQFLIYLFIVIGFFLSTTNFSKIFSSVSSVFQLYNTGSAIESTAGSLGMVLINQPLIVRTIGSIFYLLIMPIPIWAGQTTFFSLFNFFKSCFGLFNYFTIPILFIVIKDSFLNYKNAIQLRLFLIFAFFLTLSIVGLTSMDQRHMGNFSLIYILLLCFINRDNKNYIFEYRYLIKYLFISLYLLYLLYMFYKFQSIYIFSIFSIIPIIIFFLIINKKINFK